MMVWCGSDLEEMMVVWRRSRSVLFFLFWVSMMKKKQKMDWKCFPVAFLS
jgi:hypothetical protein